jgi:hypothetical protein
MVDCSFVGHSRTADYLTVDCCHSAECCRTVDYSTAESWLVAVTVGSDLMNCYWKIESLKEICSMHYY